MFLKGVKSLERVFLLYQQEVSLDYCVIIVIYETFTPVPISDFTMPHVILIAQESSSCPSYEINIRHNIVIHNYDFGNGSPNSHNYNYGSVKECMEDIWEWFEDEWCSYYDCGYNYYDDILEFNNFIGELYV